MIQLVRWATCRGCCFVGGHRWCTDRIFHGAAKDIIPGYRCKRCGKTQGLLWRWQEVEGQ